MNTVQQTYLNNTLQGNRADLIQGEFDKLVTEKGQKVIVESALQCPCKGRDVNQLSTCKNCGGTGWTFVNPTETRMVIQGLDAAVKFTGWSEELRGMVRITCLASEELSYMDKITVIEGEAVHNEVVSFLSKDGALFGYLAYPIKKINYIARFDGPSNKYQRLTLGTDFSIINGNAIVLSNAYVDVNTFITIRYVYSPVFHVLEMKRETMQSYRLTGGKEVDQSFPLSAYGRRAHYILNAPNLAGDRLLNNDYQIACRQNNLSSQVLVETEGNLYNINITQNAKFELELQITENNLPIDDILTRGYLMEVRSSLGVLLTTFSVGNGGIVLTTPNKIKLSKEATETLTYGVGIYDYDLEETVGVVTQPILAGKFIVAKQITLLP